MLQRLLNALIVLILASVLIGAFGIQIFKHEEPCPLCYLQRIGMLGVAFGALLNLRFGIRPAHYAIMLFASLGGGFIALRQISLHICPTFPLFGVPFWGFSLYTWSFFIFASTIFAVALLLLLYDGKSEVPVEDTLSKSLLWLILAIAAGNVLSILLQCGLGTCD